VLASCFASVAPLAAAERAILLLCVALVVAAEAANSALEALVDLVSPGWNDHARTAKDAAAAAVLALAVGSVVVFVTIAWPVLSLPALLSRPLEVAGALGAAVAGGVLPVPFQRSRKIDLGLALGAAACLVPVARAAESAGGIWVAGFLLAVAAESARRRARALPPSPHVPR
jgi:diacylglycerol kinase (ATP)